jgi:hypothetical protein
MMTQMDHFREYELRRKDWSQDADPCEHNCGYIRLGATPTRTTKAPPAFRRGLLEANLESRVGRG